MKVFWVVLLTALSTLVLAQGYRPPDGYVPNKETAIEIAQAVLVPVYGKNHVEAEKPFAAQLKDNIWTVSGTLSCPDGKGGRTHTCLGGVSVVEISKIDGRIISMQHGR